jgi:D-serine deaminase-like pyridoxal phosphate-dependent protein
MYTPVHAEIETPSVVVDEMRMLDNIRWMQQRANDNGVRLRPHIKTHKSIEITQRQIAEGAVGITTSKPDEAHVFIETGITSITVAYPLVEELKIARLLRAADYTGCDLRLIADSHTGIDAISTAAKRMSTRARVFLKIDVGLHRCGLREHDPLLEELALRIGRDDRLDFLGILSHAGHAYGAGTIENVHRIADEERQIMVRVRERLEAAGMEVLEVSVGSTPTVVAADSFEGITEIRPGNYVFMDRTQLGLGIASTEQISLTVLATVVSRNDDYLIIDAGSKVFSSDRGPHGSDALEGYGAAFTLEDGIQEDGWIVEKLSEEHGFIRRRGHDDPDIGTRLRIIPNHSCVVANLTDELVLVDNTGTPRIVQVDARGRVR